jgi:hypothetical protein
MALALPERGNHPCVARQCGHHPREHIPTPELAGPGETVVWCAACHRHELRLRRWGRLVRRPEPRLLNGLGLYSL